ncbi:MAG TPA: hypothetical protein VNK04_17760 [Gemmataceae bacterium]|nr:hypothetical protein [Gemmataceae bacterium]
MANPLQQKSVQRKLVYIVLILVLFTTASVFRRYGVEAYAQELSLREQDRADVDLTGSAIRLSLTGSRGFAMCVLWYWANQAQMKNQWNELELLVRSVTKLQPHFITPWLFQSWNLSYNVSVESDREHDQYFYITRGIELLYEGERQNKNHPDLRFAMGHYTMNKVCQGDKKNVLMSLFNMSCIDPLERDPERFRKLDERTGRTVLNEQAFFDFCSKHPQLVRRLRDKLRCSRPEKVVDFLERNKKVPTYYEDPRPDREQTPPKKDPGQRFPCLPPPRDNPFDPDALTHASRMADYVDYIDGYLVAHAWFAYAQEALPRPDPVMPGRSQPITDRTRQRIPKMTTLIFRMFPARALSYVAERLEQEGWFDDRGWTIDEREASRSQKWFPDRDGVEVGGRLKWGVEFWGRAHKAWQRYGEDNRLLLPETERFDLERKAREFRSSQGVTENDRTRWSREEEVPEPLREGWLAHMILVELNYYTHLTNFRHFYFTSMVEAKPETVQARKRFFEAEQLRLQARRAEALEKYEAPDALPMWKELLETHPDFQKDDMVQEETYEIQQKYLDLVRAVRGPDLKRDLTVQSGVTWMAQAAAPPAAGPRWLPMLTPATLLTQPAAVLELGLVGPFDGNTKRGDPFIRPEVREVARTRAAANRPPGR